MAAKGDRTEAPTPKRKRDARRKGQVAKSMELVMWMQVYAATVLVQMTARTTSDTTTNLIEKMSFIIQNPDERKGTQLLREAAQGAAVALLPLALGGMAIAVVGNLAQTGFLLTGHRLKPSAERINPFKGLKRMLSGEHLNEQLRSIVRLMVLAAVVWRPLWTITRKFVATPTSLGRMTSEVGIDGIALARRVAMVGLVFGAIDYALQRRKLLKQTRMTKQEVKDEHRSMEGDPHIRSQRRARQMELSRNRMMQDIAGATAVVVNPTHFAVAIKYNPTSGAPRVVAKGAGAIAARIRLEAERHGVPIVREIGLARALYRSCRVGQEIPVALYEAVARLLAFVFAVGKRAPWAGPLTIAGPPLVPVPPDANADEGDAHAQDWGEDADEVPVTRTVTGRGVQGRPRTSEAL